METLPTNNSLLADAANPLTLILAMVCLMSVIFLVLYYYLLVTAHRDIDDLQRQLDKLRNADDKKR